MENVTIENIPEIIGWLHGSGKKFPMFIGAPGIGKTEVVEATAKTMGKELVSWDLTGAQPSEVTGIRMPDTEERCLDTWDDKRMAKATSNTWIFFDEILEANPALYPPLLNMLTSLKLASGRAMPEDVFVIGASNPVKSPAQILPAFRNRFMFFNVKLDKEVVKRYFERKYGVELPHVLLMRLEENSNSYNIFTPRSLEKLFVLQNTLDDDNFKRLCCWMYDIDMYNEMKKIVPYEPIVTEEEVKRLLVRTVDVCDNPLFKSLVESEDWEQALEIANNDDKLKEALLKASTMEDSNV